MLTYADVCRRMLTYAAQEYLKVLASFVFTNKVSIFAFVPVKYAAQAYLGTYAGVCWRMLTYTDLSYATFTCAVCLSQSSIVTYLFIFCLVDMRRMSVAKQHRNARLPGAII